MRKNDEEKKGVGLLIIFGSWFLVSGTQCTKTVSTITVNLLGKKKGDVIPKKTTSPSKRYTAPTCYQLRRLLGLAHLSLRILVRAPG